MEEIWKDIKGYEDLYQASNLGRIKSLARTTQYRHMKRVEKENIMQPQKGRGKYKLIALSKNGNQHMFQVHRLIWETFNGKIPKGMQVNHIDENPSNNKLDNLELTTPKDNCNYGNRNRNISKKLKKPIIQSTLDGQEIACWFSTRDASTELKINRTSITSCLTGRYKSAGGYIWRYAS